MPGNSPGRRPGPSRPAPGPGANGYVTKAGFVRGAGRHHCHGGPAGLPAALAGGQPLRHRRRPAERPFHLRRRQPHVPAKCQPVAVGASRRVPQQPVWGRVRSAGLLVAQLQEMAVGRRPLRRNGRRRPPGAFERLVGDQRQRTAHSPGVGGDQRLRARPAYRRLGAVQGPVRPRPAGQRPLRPQCFPAREVFLPAGG